MYANQIFLAVAILLILGLVLYTQRAPSKGPARKPAPKHATGYVAPPKHALGYGTGREKFDSDPYAVLHAQIDAQRGVPSSGQRPTMRPSTAALAARAEADAIATAQGGEPAADSLDDRDEKTRRIAEAEQAQWGVAGGAAFDSETAGDVGADTLSHHHAQPELDYDTYLTDLVVDSRTRENHRQWANEMKPWSGVARSTDDLDMETFVHFHGLRRPQAVAQHNPWQITEIDGSDLAKNPKFNFRG